MQVPQGIFDMNRIRRWYRTSVVGMYSSVIRDAVVMGGLLHNTPKTVEERWRRGGGVPDMM